VPAYNPNVVYGTWPYPPIRRPTIPPPVGWGLGSALLTGMAFAGGVALVGSLWGWASPGWGGGDININANRYNNINVNRAPDQRQHLAHDTTHRQGVAYRNDEVRNRYQGDRRRRRPRAREQFRGRTRQAAAAAGRPTGGDRRPDRAGRGPPGRGIGQAIGQGAGPARGWGIRRRPAREHGPAAAATGPARGTAAGGRGARPAR
jgi:hypothetical protein